MARLCDVSKLFLIGVASQSDWRETRPGDPFSDPDPYPNSEPIRDSPKIVNQARSKRGWLLKRIHFLFSAI